jgi:RimJ/RimL family protein N-acetyltransferase
MRNRNYPTRSVLVRALNMMARLAPVRSKYYLNSILLRKRLSGSLEVPASNDYRFDWAGPEDVRYIMAHSEALQGHVYDNRVTNGDRCFCAKQGGEIVSYNWIRFTSCCALCGFERGLSFLPLQSDQAFTYDFYTYSKYRGKHIGRLLKMHLLHALNEIGINEVYTLIRPHNEISMKIQLRLGYEPVQMIFGYQILKWKKVLYGSARDNQRMSQWALRFMAERGIG